MNAVIKTYADASVKAAADEHIIEFYAAAFSDMPDKAGDIIDPHAFDDWLEKFYADGKPLPISFAHEAVLADGQAEAMREMIGYAPATKDHVWVDDYGLRVRAILFNEDKANQVYERAKAGLIPAASFAYRIAPDGTRELKSGATLITRIEFVGEAGPCLDPMNDDAVFIGAKAAIPVRHTATLDAPWDGPRMVAKIAPGADPEQMRAMFAWADPDGDPNLTSSYKFPHHDVDDDGLVGKANVRGIRNALARLPEAIIPASDREDVRAHLEAHLADFEDAKATAHDHTHETGTEDEPALDAWQAAHDALVALGAKCAPGVEPLGQAPDGQVKSEDRKVSDKEPRPEELRLGVDPLDRLRLIAADVLI